MTSFTEILLTHADMTVVFLALSRISRMLIRLNRMPISTIDIVKKSPYPKYSKDGCKNKSDADFMIEIKHIFFEGDI